MKINFSDKVKKLINDLSKSDVYKRLQIKGKKKIKEVAIKVY